MHWRRKTLGVLRACVCVCVCVCVVCVCVKGGDGGYLVEIINTAQTVYIKEQYMGNTNIRHVLDIHVTEHYKRQDLVVIYDRFAVSI